jgi:multidrug resistance efflux pump
VAIIPGQRVQKGDLLFSYDEKKLLYRYTTAQKNVDLLQAEIKHAYVLRMDNPQEASDLSLLELKAKKGEVELAFAKQELDLSKVKAPISGLITIGDPNLFRGKPVKVGEKILLISNPEQTKLKIWIPERDNIAFLPNQTITVFLNPFPEKSFEAHLTYISNVAQLSADKTWQFVAEGSWKNVDQPPELGLRGSAVLYGERISLFYYLFRKPLAITRKFLGV